MSRSFFSIKSLLEVKAQQRIPHHSRSHLEGMPLHFIAAQVSTRSHLRAFHPITHQLSKSIQITTLHHRPRSHFIPLQNTPLHSSKSKHCISLHNNSILEVTTRRFSTLPTITRRHSSSCHIAPCHPTSFLEAITLRSTPKRFTPPLEVTTFHLHHSIPRSHCHLMLNE